MITINGLAVPAFLYGTAWKEAATTELTEMAIAQGFRVGERARCIKFFDRSSCAIGRAADEHGVGNGPQCINIPSRIGNRLQISLFRRHKEQRPQGWRLVVG